MAGYGRYLMPSKPLPGDQSDPQYEHYDTPEELEKGQIKNQMFEDRLNRREANRSQLRSGQYEVERTVRQNQGKGPPDRY